MALQGHEGYLPPLVPMETAAALQVGLAENIFLGMTGFLHFPVLLQGGLGPFYSTELLHRMRFCLTLV